jgi:hypothetical protein
MDALNAYEDKITYCMQSKAFLILSVSTNQSENNQPQVQIH